MDEIHVQYQGFTPSEFTRAFLETKLSELQDRAPYGSTVRATFVRVNERLKAHLRILSSAGEFSAIAQGRRLRDVSRKLLSQIHKQIQRWKTRRHGGWNNDHVVA
jgi:hypothetical protein